MITSTNTFFLLLALGFQIDTVAADDVDCDAYGCYDDDMHRTWNSTLFAIIFSIGIAISLICIGFALWRHQRIWRFQQSYTMSQTNPPDPAASIYYSQVQNPNAIPGMQYPQPAYPATTYDPSNAIAANRPIYHP